MQADEQTERCPIFPGPVANPETVVRVLYSPHLFDKGEPTPGVFRKDELNDWTKDVCGASSGVSLQRTPPCTAAVVEDLVTAFIGGDPNRSAAPYHLSANVADLREIKIDGAQALKLFADGREGDEGHCVMRAAIKITDGNKRALRGKLLQAFQPWTDY